MFHRVVITGVGVVSPYGVGAEALWQGLKSSKNPLRFSEFLGVVVGAVPTKEEDPQYGLDLSKWTPGQQREMCRGSLLVLAAADEAIADAKLQDEDHTETGVNIGMGISDLEAIYDSGKKIENGEARRISPFFVPKILTNIPASYVSLKYGMKGGNSSSTTACATGANCIGDAVTNIRIGRQRRVLAGGVESCLNPIAIQGFRRMRALASKPSVCVSRPFDKDREGFVLSEGVGLVMLERAEDAMKRNSKIYAEVVGYGLGNDAFHLTAPSEDGLGSTLCIQRALKDANIDDLRNNHEKYSIYINAHATSTPVGDSAEAKSIENVLPGVAVSSIKGHIGHTLAAAGSIETIVTSLSISESLMIGTKNLDSPITENINLIRGITPWKTRPNQRKLAIKNSFGFGGAFISLVLTEFLP